MDINKVKEYLSWNNIPYSIEKQYDYIEAEGEHIAIQNGEKLVIDFTKVIGGHREAFLKFIRENG